MKDNKQKSILDLSKISNIIKVIVGIIIVIWIILLTIAAVRIGSSYVIALIASLIFSGRNGEFIMSLSFAVQILSILTI